MFHEGDLQSGIASALQQSKAVLCFVHGSFQPFPPVSKADASPDDREDSQTWEKTILNNEQACPKVSLYWPVFKRTHRLLKQSEAMLWPCEYLQVHEKPNF
jgi:hypothetical protein